MTLSRALTAALVGFLAIGAATAPADIAHADDAHADGAPPWRHATALIGEPKRPEGFKQFDYVNPDAPKGGLVRLSSTGSFDSFNPILAKGDAAPGILLIYESLAATALDEADTSTMYGQIAEALQYPDDYAWVKYRLRPEARWHDGTPITPEDVVWSFEKTVELNPTQRFYYSHIEKAEVSGEHEVTFTFDQTGNRELPHIVGQLNVLPKHWWTGKDANGNTRDIGSTTLEPPLGSGPYKIAKFTAGRSITYERVDDYWGKDLPFGIGQNNFDEIRYEVFLDRTVLLEAFKGDQYDWRSENSAKSWATGYDFPAVRDGRVVLEKFPDKASGIMQAFVPNLRLEKFADWRVRRALNLAWDFETANRTLFYNEYKRIQSYFAGTELASSGVPEGRELEILEEVRGKVPDELFTEPYSNPVAGDPTKLRQNLREALRLLKEAGWEFKGRQLVNAATGEPFTIEYLGIDPDFERIVLPYAQNLKKIGIELKMRVVDTSQYINRLRSFDFEMITFSWPESLSPGNEQRDFWGSEAAGNPASRNFAGIRDEAVDSMIERVIFAKDRKDLIAATHALDRVLLWNNFMTPQFYVDYDRTARWDRFGRPEKLPEFTHGFPTIWWYDEEKAEKTGKPS
ncbi:microcin C transport system substrate-binding protein [Rhodobium orientis]|uniref:Solute-binding protein family 5 domain-containing protein n=1 Tax=Rhodobium orientis TaxID=34017 RepID=A0A327JKN3_9HYPH|nr:extracellular solute-binding protein [Rhodobium orientis]MBB4304526.1 microcin C transport system substrate-binding protein [Rhodobium orientis]MBK5948117.1 hypothetical protein [Rhodobium orientis]RAI26196.1 hypothetical protein CH339_15090 [Rhodobium orientis]